MGVCFLHSSDHKIKIIRNQNVATLVIKATSFILVLFSSHSLRLTWPPPHSLLSLLFWEKKIFQKQKNQQVRGPDNNCAIFFSATYLGLKATRPLQQAQELLQKLGDNSQHNHVLQNQTKIAWRKRTTAYIQYSKLCFCWATGRNTRYTYKSIN